MIMRNPKKTILSILITLISLNHSFAQCETWNNYPQGEEEAKKQHVLYRDKIKLKNYEEAYPIWLNLFQYVELKKPKQHISSMVLKCPCILQKKIHQIRLNGSII